MLRPRSGQIARSGAKVPVMAKHSSRANGSNHRGTARGGLGRRGARVLVAAAVLASSLCCRSELQATGEPPRAREATSASEPSAGSAAGGGAPASSAGEPRDVSIVELLGGPERFRGQRVRLIGFVSLEFEGKAVYLHEEDYVRAIMRNALWLEVAGNGPAALAKPGYAIIEGRYEPDSHGHMSMFSGALTQVTRMSPWPGRQTAPQPSRGVP